jgi:ArsR family transcriptional regulator
MINSKIDAFNTEEIRISEIAKALSHPVRVRILKILNENNVCQCGELVELLPLAQSTVSQHLKELKNVGLIHGEIDGPKICYCINVETLSESKKLYLELFSSLKCC